MDDIEWAWLAGLFEGEGTVGVFKNGARHYVRLRIAMTDEDTVNRACRFASVGSVSSYISSRENSKRMYQWGTSGISNIESIYEKFKPFLSVRRTEQFESAINRYYESRV